ncbi:MAG: porin family protein [Rhodomicrobium sp.]|nr:porin family protein [Rhodomicrobium sp.]
MKDAPSYAAPLSWTGFYLGANAGYAWSDSDRSNIEVFRSPQDGGTLYDSGPLPYELSPEGGFAGVQLGYNHQSGNIVLGIEADIQASDIGDSSKTSFVDPGEIADFDYFASADIEWFGTVRGRIGYSFDRTLLYITGGFAYGEVNYQADYVFTDPACCTGSFGVVGGGETKTGYVLGAGIEHMLDANWSLKAEYQYIDLGTLDVDGALFFSDGSPSGETVESKIDADFHTVRVGLNYRFGGAEAEPLK